MTFLTRAYGLVIRSDIALRGPLAAPDGAVPDLVMEQGPVPEALAHVDGRKRDWEANARELLLAVPDVGRFHVQDGMRVTYERADGALDNVVGGFLLGSCIGAALHQRGIPVLHGACVTSGDRAVAICGKSGRGKSTTAAWLVERGARMLSDDLVVFEQTEPPVVLPGYPQSKLTASALAGIGRGTEGLREVDEERGKFAVPRTDLFVDKPLSLAAIFVIETGSRSDLSCERVGGVEAVRRLVKHTYRRGYVVDPLAGAYFDALGRIASQVPVWMMVRPRAQDSTAQVASVISREIERATGAS